MVCLRNITQMLGGNIQGAKSHKSHKNKWFALPIITCEEAFSVIVADSNR